MSGSWRRLNTLTQTPHALTQTMVPWGGYMPCCKSSRWRETAASANSQAARRLQLWQHSEETKTDSRKDSEGEGKARASELLPYIFTSHTNTYIHTHAYKYSGRELLGLLLRLLLVVWACSPSQMHTQTHTHTSQSGAVILLATQTLPPPDLDERWGRGKLVMNNSWEGCGVPLL